MWHIETSMLSMTSVTEGPYCCRFIKKSVGAVVVWIRDSN